jgi:hypothetical protein
VTGAHAARRLVLSIGLCLGAVFTQAWSVQAAPAVPLPHYQLVAGLDIDAASLNVHEVVRFTNTYGVPLDSLVFKTSAGALTSLSLSAVTVDGQPVTWTFDASGSVLELQLPAGHASDAATSVALDWALLIPHQPGRLSLVTACGASGSPRRARPFGPRDP